MMKPLLLVVAACATWSLPHTVLADVGLKNSGAYVGPVRDLNCVVDAGLACTRVSSAVRGDLACTTATQTQTGCVIPGAQSFSGNKFIDGGLSVANDFGAATVTTPIINAVVFDGGFVTAGIIATPNLFAGQVRINPDGGLLLSDGGAVGLFVGQTPIPVTTIGYATGSFSWTVESASCADHQLLVVPACGGCSTGVSAASQVACAFPQAVLPPSVIMSCFMGTDAGVVIVRACNLSTGITLDAGQYSARIFGP